MKLDQLIILLTSLILFPLLCSIRPAPAFREVSFFIDGDSELSLKGSSNVNEFSCLCLCVNEGQRYFIRIETESYSQYAEFDQADLQLQTEALDCGHKGINKDLYKTLESDQHPYIVIELLKARMKERRTISAVGKWSNITTKTAITIAGVTRHVEMNVRGQRLSDGRYRFVSSKDLYMSDFQIDPPKPLFGLIKVHDLIQINIDLFIRLAESG
jgi:hypothetical protein